MRRSEIHKALRHCDTYLNMVEEKVEAARRVIDEMRYEYRNYDVKMKNKDIAEFLDVSETTVWRMLKDDRLKSRRMRHVLELKNKR